MNEPKTWQDVVRTVFPDAPDEFAELLLWEETGFPSFWRIPEDGAKPVECCVTQLKRAKARMEGKP